MSQKDLIGKLTPDHFAQGKSFDKEAFASLIVLLQKQASKAWTFIILPLMLGLSFVPAYGIGGFIGNIMAVIFIFLGPVLMLLLMGKTNKQVKSARNALGITPKDINIAIRQLRKEHKQESRGKTVWFYTSLLLSFLLYTFMLIAMIGESPDIDNVSGIIVLLLVVAGYILGIIGIIRCLGLKWEGALLAIVTVVLHLIGALIIQGGEISEFAGGFAFVSTISMILLLTIIPYIQKTVKAGKLSPAWFSKTWKIMSVIVGIIVILIPLMYLEDAGLFEPYSHTYTYVRSDGKNITDADFKEFETVFKIRFNDYKKEKGHLYWWVYKVKKNGNEINISINNRYHLFSALQHPKNFLL